MATPYDSGHFEIPRRRRTILDKLEKPRVAVPMILLSALVGLALALLAVRTVGPRAVPRGDAVTQEEGKPARPRVDVRTAESDVLQPQHSIAPPAAPPVVAAREEAVPAAPAAGATASVAVPSPVSPATSAAGAQTPAPATRAPDRDATPSAAPAGATPTTTPSVATAPAAPSPTTASPRAATPAGAASPGTRPQVVPGTGPAPTTGAAAAPRAPAGADQAARFGPSVAVAVAVPEPRRAAPDVTPRARDASAPAPTGAVDAEAARSVRDVLNTAAIARQDGDVYAAASGMRRAHSAAAAPGQSDPALARRLNADAGRAFWQRQDLPEALRLQERAFAANPDDPEIAGNLAFYYLKQDRADPRRAHDAAVQALTRPALRNRAGRMEDWTSLGVAHALMGHVTEARDAFLVTAAVSNDLDRVCRAGLNAVASYGDDLRAPVTAMLYRIHQQGRSKESPYCAWPPNWSAGRRYP